MMMLESKGIHKDFGGVKALSDVHLSVPDDVIMGLIGPNGAGKTTFFNVISGILQASAGDFYFRGKKLTGKRPYYITRTGIARTFQNIQLFTGMTVFENIVAGRHIRTRAGLVRGILGGGLVLREERENREKVDELLDFVQITSERDLPAESLPYGKQRHVEIARALAVEPELLLLDEPSAGMNPKETEDLMELIRAIRKRGVTVLLIEHDMNLIMGICDRIAVLDYGKKISEGTPDEIRNDEKVIEAYLGREEEYADLG
jgi:branched-chain amino acid transport system ATP-binding protein